MLDSKLQLELAFADVTYSDISHSYRNIKKDYTFISVTQFLGKLKPAFHELKWSTWRAFQYNGYTTSLTKKGFTAKKDDVKYSIVPGETDLKPFNLKPSVEDVVKEWNLERDLGTSRGSYLHACLENLDKRDVTVLDNKPYCTERVLNVLENEYYRFRENNTSHYTLPEQEIQVGFETLNSLARKFKSENEYLIPIASEFVVGDVDLGIAGKFDSLYYNLRSQQYEIWDYKNDKKLERSNQYGKIALFDLDDCEFEKYSLQTSLYKYIIEKNTPIKLGTSHIVHFKFRDNSYDIIPCNDYTELIKEKLNDKHWSESYIKAIKS